MNDQHPIEEQLAALHDGALDVAERAEVEAHVAGCTTCRATLAELAALDAALVATPAADPGPAYWARFADRVAEKTRPRPEPARIYERLTSWLFSGGRFAWPRAAGAVAAFTLLFYVGLRGVRTDETILRPHSGQSRESEIDLAQPNLPPSDTAVRTPESREEVSGTRPAPSSEAMGTPPALGDAPRASADGSNPPPAPLTDAENPVGSRSEAGSSVAERFAAPPVDQRSAVPPAPPRGGLPATLPTPEAPVAKAERSPADFDDQGAGGSQAELGVPAEAQSKPTLPGPPAPIEDPALRSRAMKGDARALSQVQKPQTSPSLEAAPRADAPSSVAPPAIAPLPTSPLATKKRTMGFETHRQQVALAPIDTLLASDSRWWEKRDEPAARQRLAELTTALAARRDDPRAVARARTRLDWLVATSTSDEERERWNTLLRSLPPH